MIARMKRRTFTLFIATLMVGGVLPLTAAADNIIPAKSKLFIEEMDGDLDGYIRAEISKQKIPVQVVLSAEAADFIMIGSSKEKKGKWHEGWLTTRDDHAQGNISIINPKEKSILWSSEAGDRSMWKGTWSRGGERKVAERLVHNLRSAVGK